MLLLAWAFMSPAYLNQCVKLIAQFLGQSLWYSAPAVVLALKTWIQLRGK